MYTRSKLITLIVAALLASASFAQDDAAQRDKEELQMIALEALMASPSERALPAILKLLDGNGSDELKENALFVLSQIDHPDASAKLLAFAHDGSGETQLEAIRMIAINGEDDAMAGLADIYANGDEDVREAVLEAYLIADDTQAVFNIAMNTTDEEDYEAAVEILGAMDAHDELAELREAKGVSDALIEAYIMSGNHVELELLARDSSDVDMQAEAIQALGIVDGPNSEQILVEIYKSSEHEDIREASMEGLLIGDYDNAILELYRSSTSNSEKGELLEALVIMDSDLAMDVIDAALAGDQ